MTAPTSRRYRVIRRRPVEVTFRGHRVRTNAPPSSGGLLLAYALALNDRLPPARDPLAASSVRTLAAILREAEAQRGPALARSLVRGGARRLLDADVGRARRRAVLDALRRRRRRVAELAAPRGTSHVSVVDAAGNAVAMTSSTGCGSGVFAGTTGLHLNNMLGEEDLTGHGAAASRRAADVDDVADHRGGPGRLRAVAGSSGSARIRSAMLAGAGRADRARRSSRARRSTCRGSTSAAGLDCELGFPDGDAGASSSARRARSIRGPTATSTSAAAQVATLRGGRFAAAGDPRRGGDAVVVQA